jgi:hypothetical protein
MGLQGNASRILSEEGEIPRNLFFTEGVVGRVSARGKPTVMRSCLQISFNIVNNAIWSPLALSTLAG